MFATKSAETTVRSSTVAVGMTRGGMFFDEFLTSDAELSIR